MPAIDRDEARVMQATKQMIESGDYGRIRFQNEPRDKKPPGVHWLQAASVTWLAGEPTNQRWPYRIPSVLGVLLAVLANAALVRRLADGRSALTAGAILASAPIVVIEGHLAKADAVLLGLSGVCFAVLGLTYTRRLVPSVALIAFWMAVGVSVVIKGPVLPGLCIAAIAALAIVDRGAGWLWRLQPLLGLPLAATAMLAWAQIAGWDEVSRFSRSAAMQDLLPKLTSGVESHGAPPGSYVLAASLTLWPWSILAPLAAIVAWRRRAESDVRFCLAWIIPFWLGLEAMPTKLPHYILPLVPAIALLMTHQTALRAETSSGATRWAARATTLIFPLAVTVGCAAGISSGLVTVSPPLILAMALPWIITAMAWRPENVLPRISTIVVLLVLFQSALFQWILPNADRLNVAGALAARIAPGTPVALAGFHEPSAVFALGTETTLTDTADAADFILARSDGLAVIAADELAAAEARAAEQNRKLMRLDRISGYNYGRGNEVDLILVKEDP